MIALGRGQKDLEPLRWEKGQGARQTAFLCYSSGTSGLPVSLPSSCHCSDHVLTGNPIQKGVMISHRNVIANTMQIVCYDGVYRKTKNDPNTRYEHQENALGLLPFSHIYGLVVIAHSSVYQGDGVIVLPKFEMNTCLAAIQNFKINTLYIVSSMNCFPLGLDAFPFYHLPINPRYHRSSFSSPTTVKLSPDMTSPPSPQSSPAPLPWGPKRQKTFKECFRPG